MNTIRARAGVPALASIDANGFLAERGREMFCEGHRRQDLIRFGKYSGGTYIWAWKGNAAGGVAISSNRNLFPIPQLALVANPKLTQNTGY